MKILPLFLGGGLLCAGLAVGCADSGTDSGRAANAPAPGDVPAAPDVVEATWVADANVTQAHLEVVGMTWGGCAAAVRSSLANLEGVEDVLIDQATGDVHLKCADGVELSQDAVAAAVEADERFTVTEFTMQTPEAATETE